MTPVQPDPPPSSRAGASAPARRWARLGAFIAAAWLGGLIAYGVRVAEMPRIVQSKPQPPTEAIVVLTGGSNRIEVGMALLRAGQGERLLISGVGRNVRVEDLLKDQAGALKDKVTLGTLATTTFGNAEEVADFVGKHGIRSLTVVTSDYHMPRALLELRRRLPKDVALQPQPVEPALYRGGDWWESGQGIALVTGEYCKWTLVMLRALVEDAAGEPARAGGAGHGGIGL